MKKKMLLIVISLCLITLVGGCKKESSTDSNGAPIKKAYTASKYVTLGQYKGVEVTVNKFEVTDADVDSAIHDDLKAKATYKDITDRPVKSGDKVNIDYEGLKDGVAFSGGTAKGYDLEIGSNSFIPGFEDGLIGKKLGEKVALNLTFPENYSNSPELAGQAVVFNVTVNSISEPVIPELTEEYVKANTSYDSVAAYKQAKRDSLQSYSDQYNEYYRTSSVIQKVIDNATIKSVPENLMNFYKYIYGNYNSQLISSNYGMTVEQYLTNTGKTQAEYDTEIQTAADSLARREMVEKAVAEAEGMKITEEDYQALLPQYLKDNNIDSEATLQKYESKDQTKEQMLIKKVEDFIIAQAVITEKPISTETTPTAAPTTAP